MNIDENFWANYNEHAIPALDVSHGPAVLRGKGVGYKKIVKYIKRNFFKITNT